MSDARVDYGRRLDVKLDSLMKRSLPVETYERILTCEFCVVVTPEEKREPRNIIVGHDLLYSSGIPPKTIRPVLRLCDVVSVNVLSDVPCFLSEKYRHKTVHVQVLFKRRMRDKAILSHLTQSEWSPAILRRLARRSEEVDPVSKGPTFLANISPNHNTAHLRSPLTHTGKHQEDRLPSPLTITNNTNAMDSPLLVKNTMTTPNNSASPSQFSQSSASLPTPSLEVKSEVSLLMPSLLLEQQKMYKSSTSLDQLATHHSVDKSPVMTVRMMSRHSSSLGNISASVSETSTSLDSLWGSSLSIPESRHKERENVHIEIATMDLYALRADSDLHNHISIALEDHRMSSEQDVTDTLASSSSFPERRESMSQQFLSLKADLLSSRELESIALLLAELCSACRKYFLLKRLFWQDSDLLELCVRELKGFCETRPDLGPSLPLLDCIEFSVIVMELLLNVLSETHVCEKRFELLTRNSGQLLESVSTAVVGLFPVLSKIHSIDNSELVGEFTENACGALYELSRVVQQVSWRTVLARSSASISWWCDVVTQHSAMSCLCAFAVSYLCRTLPPSKDHGQVAVKVYRVVSLLLTLVQHSSSFLHHCQEHFIEEFRYLLGPQLSAATAGLLGTPLTKDSGLTAVLDSKLCLLKSQIAYTKT